MGAHFSASQAARRGGDGTDAKSARNNVADDVKPRVEDDVIISDTTLQNSASQSSSLGPSVPGNDDNEISIISLQW